MKIYTVTIWQAETGFEPCTVAFDEREKANAFKDIMEKIFAAGGADYYHVTLDACVLNDGNEYKNAFASEMEVDVPAEPEEVEEDKELTVSYAVEGRYFATVRLPKGTVIPGRNASREEQEQFIQTVKDASIIDYYDADFGELQDIDGRAIIIEDDTGNIIWEEGMTTLVYHGRK